MKRPIGLALITTIAVLATSVQIAPAQTSGNKPADARIKAALDQLGLKYEVQNGDFKVTAKLDGGRLQTAWIMSKTQKLGNMEIREIASAGYKSNGSLLAEVANRLLADNTRWKMGRWQIETGKDKTSYAVFSTRIAADTDPQTLKTSLNMTLYSADDMEKELTGKDIF